MEFPTIRYALIGAGSAARVHLRQMTQEPGVTVVGVADPAESSHWRIPAMYQDLPRFTGAEQLLRETQPDLVSICTPNLFHCESTLLALQAGAHVVCEKPMAMTIGDARKMEAARRVRGKLGAINFSYRNVASFRFARALLAKGELGRLRRASVSYLQSFLGCPSKAWTWRNDVTLAGFGALGDLGVHMIDSMRFITGLTFQRVVGVAQSLLPQRMDGAGVMHPVTTDTNAAFLAELSGGMVAAFEATQIAPGYGDFFRLEISGERGTLVVQGETPSEIQLYLVSDAAPAAPWETNISPRKLPSAFPGRDTPETPGAIVHALRGEPVDFPSFADGVAAQQVLDAFVRSARSNAWEAVE